jgi:hypothetical protein
MKQQKYYTFLQQQILLMIGLTLLPGIVYVVLGFIFKVFLPALLWYGSLLVISFYGWSVYKDFSARRMSEEELEGWYNRLKWFMYLIFAAWLVVFLLFVDCQKSLFLPKSVLLWLLQPSWYQIKNSLFPFY